MHEFFSYSAIIFISYRMDSKVHYLFLAVDRPKWICAAIFIEEMITIRNQYAVYTH